MKGVKKSKQTNIKTSKKIIKKPDKVEETNKITNENKIKINTESDFYNLPIEILKNTKISDFYGNFYDMIFSKAIDIQTNGGKKKVSPAKKKKTGKKIIINIKKKAIPTRRNQGLKENTLDKYNNWCNQNDSSIDTSDNNIINNSLCDGSINYQNNLNNSIYSNYLNFKNTNSMNQNELMPDLSASAVLTNFPVLSELKIKTINFELKHDTEIGETMGIIGSLNELGLWKQSKALKMVWNKGNIWTTSLNLNSYNNVINFEYKFIILANGKIKYWEEGNNRKFTFSEVSGLIEPYIDYGDTRNNIINVNNGMVQTFIYDINNCDLKIICHWNKK